MKKEAQIYALFEEAREDNVWMAKEYKRLRREYADEFIVVRGKTVLTHSKELEDILAYIEKKEIDPATVVVDFVTEKQINLIL